jgi:hypothetical protein
MRFCEPIFLAFRGFTSPFVLRRAGKPVSKHPSGQKIGDYASRRRKKMRLLSTNGPVPVLFYQKFGKKSKLRFQ